MTTSILVGSNPVVPATSIRVTVALTEDLPVAAGSYYLEDGDSSFDLIEAVEVALNTHTEIADAVVTIQGNEKVRMTATPSFQINSWDTGGSTVVRNMLGFTSNLPTSTTHDAPLISDFFWASGKNEISDARLSTDGLIVKDTAVGQSGPGVVVATENNQYRIDRYLWRYVTDSRVWTTSELGGEYFVFWDEVLSKFFRFKHYRDVTLTGSVSDTISFGASQPSTGAWQMKATMPLRFPFAREVRHIERSHPVDLKMVQTIEYT